MRMSAQPDPVDIPCPWCGLHGDRGIGLDGTPPGAGDISVCWHCTRPAVYLEPGRSRRLEGRELVRVLAEDPELAALIIIAGVTQTPHQAAEWLSYLPKDGL